MKKLLSQLKALFTFNGDVDLKPDENSETMLEEIQKAHKQQLEQPSVEVNLDTGKITLPENMTEEEKKAVEEIMQELQKSFQGMVQFQSLEDFLREGGSTGRGFQIPFTTVNNLPDGQIQVLEEMNNCKDDTDHWTDSDFIEALFGYYNQGVEFPGIEAMNNKLNERQELLPEEKKQLRQWYMLVSQELVYDV